ncbi:MAG: dipeptide epimerase [Ktedonobacteraceae bacterium]
MTVEEVEKLLPTVKKIVWYHYWLPVPMSFNTAHQQLVIREGAIVEVYTDVDITGVGEIAPLPEFAGGSIQDVLSCLPVVVERLRGKDVVEAMRLLHAEFAAIPSSAMCGIETALLDARGQIEQRSLSALLAQSAAPARSHSPVRSSISVNAVIGGASIETTVTRAREAVAAGFSCIKLKMGRDGEADVARVAAVRAAIGPSIALRLDANEGWTLELARAILARCAAFDIQYVEQPLARHDLAGMRTLRENVPVAIAADEALSDLASVERVLAARAADIFIIKPQLAGGLYNAQHLLQLASEHGLQCVITSSIEAGIGIAAALHLAASTPQVTLACGLGTLPMLENDLIGGTLPIYNGTMQVPTGPGLGVSLDRTALKLFSAPIKEVGRNI